MRPVHETLRFPVSRRELFTGINATLHRLRTHSELIGQEVKTSMPLSISRRSLIIGSASTGVVGALMVHALRTIQERSSAGLAAEAAKRAAQARENAERVQDFQRHQDMAAAKLIAERTAIEQYVLYGNAHVDPREDLQKAIGKTVIVDDLAYPTEGTVTSDGDPLIPRAYPLKADPRKELQYKFYPHALRAGEKLAWQRELTITMWMPDGRFYREVWAIRDIRDDQSKFSPDELQYIGVKENTINTDGDESVTVPVYDGRQQYILRPRQELQFPPTQRDNTKFA